MIIILFLFSTLINSFISTNELFFFPPNLLSTPLGSRIVNECLCGAEPPAGLNNSLTDRGTPQTSPFSTSKFFLTRKVIWHESIIIISH